MTEFEQAAAHVHASDQATENMALLGGMVARFYRTLIDGQVPPELAARLTQERHWLWTWAMFWPNRPPNVAVTMDE